MQRFCHTRTEEQQQQLLYELYDTETLFHKILHKIYKLIGYKGHEHPFVEGRPKFRGDDKRDIYCKEPEEPDAIHWTDLGEHVSTELKQRAVTAVITAGLLFCVLLIEAVIFDAWTEDLILDFQILHAPYWTKLCYFYLQHGISHGCQVFGGNGKS